MPHVSFLARTFSSCVLASLGVIACSATDAAPVPPPIRQIQEASTVREQRAPWEVRECEQTCSCRFRCRNGDEYEDRQVACDKFQRPACTGGNCGYCAEQGGVEQAGCASFVSASCGLCYYTSFRRPQGDSVPVLQDHTCAPGYTCSAGYPFALPEGSPVVGTFTMLCFPRDDDPR